jgi:hypothetical protein
MRKKREFFVNKIKISRAGKKPCSGSGSVSF